MSDVKVNFDLMKIQPQQMRLLGATFHDIGQHCMRESKANAPRSPTVKQMSRTLVRRRRKRMISLAGGLEKSIEYEVKNTSDGLSAHVFVAANSPAGKYANYIHNLKRIKWFKRGIGTKRKGARADEKFIERAVKDNIKRYTKAIEATIVKATEVK